MNERALIRSLLRDREVMLRAMKLVVKLGTLQPELKAILERLIAADRSVLEDQFERAIPYLLGADDV